MGLLLDIGLAATEGALRGALHPFAASGDITSSQADQITAGAGDLFQMFEATATRPPPDLLQSELRALFDPFVATGDVTAAKADEIAAALMDAITLAKNVATPKAPSATPAEGPPI